MHVEHFPMHQDPLPSQTLDETISIFSHGLCGKLLQLPEIVSSCSV
jgi:hypothetical protein